MSAVEINCLNCKKETLLHREAVYDGFDKIGEKLTCSACGFEYASEDEVPFVEQTSDPILFTDADRSVKISIFTEDESRKLCRYCAHYLINPFTQFCSIHKKEVQATDSCPRFDPQIEKKDTL